MTNSLLLDNPEQWGDVIRKKAMAMTVFYVDSGGRADLEGDSERQGDKGWIGMDCVVPCQDRMDRHNGGTTAMLRYISRVGMLPRSSLRRSQRRTWRRTLSPRCLVLNEWNGIGIGRQGNGCVHGSNTKLDKA